MIEERNGSDIPIKQHVWGLGYIDELCQILVNRDPADESESALDMTRFILQDANYNVLGVTNSW